MALSDRRVTRLTIPEVAPGDAAFVADRLTRYFDALPDELRVGMAKPNLEYLLSSKAYFIPRDMWDGRPARRTPGAATDGGRGPGFMEFTDSQRGRRY